MRAGEILLPGSGDRLPRVGLHGRNRRHRRNCLVDEPGVDDDGNFEVICRLTKRQIKVPEGASGADQWNLSTLDTETLAA